MPHPPPNTSEAWDGVRETVDQFHPVPPSYYTDRTGQYNHSLEYGPLTQELLLEKPSNTTNYDTIEMFKESVTKAHQTIKQSLAGSEEVSEAVNLKLSIDLKSRGLQDLPDEVVDIVKNDVESLKLDSNQISHLPYRFEECHTLRHLILRSNRFKEFPKALYRLPRLEVLDLSRNKLTKIPEEIKAMKALRVLSLTNNVIETVPFTIASLDIRILKLAGNPLNPDLARLVEGGALSPSRVTLPDNEKETIITRKLKKYLKTAKSASRDSGGDSSDGTVSTPRAPRRTLSHRFPVKPSFSGSESASDINLTIRSPGFGKPPIPAKSHFRVISGQHDGTINPTLRRPGLAPLSNGNERNRSNSESILQATQINRSKRMGMVTKKQNDLGIVDEMANRNSLHLRGQSDGSALGDRYNRSIRNAEVIPANPLRNDRQQGMFVRRLSSLPEQKRESGAPNRAVEGVKGVLYSLHLVHPHLSTLIPVVKDKSAKTRSNLERSYKQASNQYKALDLALHELEAQFRTKGESRCTCNTKFLSACEAVMTTYLKLGEYLIASMARLVSGGDQRYIRTLVLLLYGNVMEGRNAMWNLMSAVAADKPASATRGPVLPIQEEHHQPRDRSITPTRQRPNPERRLRNGLPKHSTITVNGCSPLSAVQTAVPLHVNGRSRSNSRTGPFMQSNASSVANTPRSGESFPRSRAGTPKLRSRSNSTLGYHIQSAQILEHPEHEAMFEKIFVSLTRCLDHAQRIIPICVQQFSGCLDVAYSTFTSQKIHLLWSTLISRCNVCLETSAALKKRLSTIKLNDSDVRHSKDFWRLCSRFCNSLEKFMSGVREARYLELISPELIKVIAPLHRPFSETVRFIEKSPWEYLTRREVEATNQQNHDGSYRHRTRTGSSTSPYPANVPATPLSAALGPAAQATVPTSAAFDRSFAGDVFQRAEELLRVQQTMVHRR